MLGLRNSLITSRNPGITIVTDNLVLRHDYRLHPVQPLSDGAAYFDGSSDNIQLKAAISNNVFSFSAWINVTDDATTKTILDTRDGDNDGVIFRVSSAERLVLMINNSDSAIGSAADLIAGTWQHVVGTYDGTNLKLYIDGVLIETTADAGSSETVAVTTAARIGKHSYQDSNWFNGYMANVGVWSRAITQTEIKSIMWKKYSQLNADEKTNLVSWWNLDSTVEDLGTAVYDNHHGGGDTLGSELIDNGGFDDGLDGLDGWTNGAGTFNVVDGECVFTDENGQIFQSIVVTAGNTYQVSFDYDVSTGDSVRINADGTLRLVATSGSGSYVATFVAATSSVTHHIRVYGYMGAGEECTIDNVSVKEINGNTGTLS